MGYVISGEILLRNNHYYYYYIVGMTNIITIIIAIFTTIEVATNSLKCLKSNRIV